MRPVAVGMCESKGDIEATLCTIDSLRCRDNELCDWMRVRPCGQSQALWFTPRALRSVLGGVVAAGATAACRLKCCGQ